VIDAALASAVVIAGGAAFIVFAQLARLRAVAQRGASLRTSGGLPQLAPYFFWVPYAVVALRPGPNVDVPAPLAVLGLCIAVAGVAIALWAIVTLGRHYDLLLEVHAGHELVRTGPYALVRHPVYTGLALHFAGACLATGNLLLIAGTLLVSYPAFYLRARAEEALLRREFTAEYERYAKEVGMLVPFR
jgi:protein-S-isoprenylcysteine O-methyltransferase Ste14